MINSSMAMIPNNSLIKREETAISKKRKKFHAAPISNTEGKAITGLFTEVAKTGILFCIAVILFRVPGILYSMWQAIGLGLETAFLNFGFFAIFIPIIFVGGTLVICTVGNLLYKAYVKTIKRSKYYELTKQDVLKVYASDNISNPEGLTVEKVAKKLNISKLRTRLIVDELLAEKKLRKDNCSGSVKY